MAYVGCWRFHRKGCPSGAARCFDESLGALMCLLACGASNAGLILRVFVVTE